MNQREYLTEVLRVAEDNVAAARNALADYVQSAENNLFATTQEAYDLEEILRERAAEDCEGAYNCGQEQYRQECYIDGVKHVAILDVEYNRHDKTYYYIDSADFRIEQLP